MKREWDRSRGSSRYDCKTEGMKEVLWSKVSMNDAGLNKTHRIPLFLHL